MIRRILHLSDTHGLHRDLDRLPDADVIVHSGDFTMDGTENEVFDFIEWLSDLPHTYKLFVAGNHDDCLYQAQLEGLPADVYYLNWSGVDIEGIHFYGMPMFMADILSGSYEKRIACIPSQTDILITHQPPLGILDVSRDVHWGNPILLDQLRKIVPKYHFFGHVHNAYGVEKLNNTICVNASLVDDLNKMVHKPKLFMLK